MKIYMVYVNTEASSYGINVELGGVFTNKITAETKRDIYRNRKGMWAWIVEAELDKVYLTSKDAWVEGRGPINIVYEP